jgi:hypothetical protein
VKVALFFSLFFLVIFQVRAQNTLFDDTRVSSLYIDLNPDSLNYIMTEVLSDHYFGARFIYDDGTSRDTLEQVGFRLRGNTSRYSAKKSYKISFNEYVPGRRYQDVKKINLNGQHNDPTLLREKLYYHTWKKAGLPERRTSFVKLYINGTYYGLYTNLEEFDKDWLDRVYGESEGNLYKCTYPADLVYINNNQQSYKDIESGSVTGGRAYDLQTNESGDDYSDLLALISILSLPADSTFAAAISQVMNVDGTLKVFALDVATGNWDDYMYNKNNYFLYQNQFTGKFEFISYDTDNTFGVDWINRDWATRNCLDWFIHSEPRPLATKLLSIPSFNYQYRCYLDTIARQVINPDSIFPVIDYYKSLITTAVLDDTYRSLDFGYTFQDFNDGFTKSVDGHTPYGIKPFLEFRKSKILEQLTSNSIANRKKTEGTLELYPNPAKDMLMVKTNLKGKRSRYVIMDQKGYQWLNGEVNVGKSPIEIQLDQLPEGIYILKLSIGGNSMSGKFVKN